MYFEFNLTEGTLCLSGVRMALSHLAQRIHFICVRDVFSFHVNVVTFFTQRIFQTSLLYMSDNSWREAAFEIISHLFNITFGA